ncbi:MAG: hypothetical protein L3J56_06390 [Bacteroidales bacterium]|nr:hypothetical protein [Bacteroidales bacterium]
MLSTIANKAWQEELHLVQNKQQKIFKSVDNCRVTNLSGLFGGLAAIFVVDNLSVASQLSGIGITILIAAVSVFLSEKLFLFSEKEKFRILMRKNLKTQNNFKKSYTFKVGFSADFFIVPAKQKQSDVY